MDGRLCWWAACFETARKQVQTQTCAINTNTMAKARSSGGTVASFTHTPSSRRVTEAWPKTTTASCVDRYRATSIHSHARRKAGNRPVLGTASTYTDANVDTANTAVHTAKDTVDATRSGWFARTPYAAHKDAK